MYDDLICKMIEHFKDIGSILDSKAYDFFNNNPISNEDVEMYYDLLCSDEVIPQNINKRNHKMCCLFYLSKFDENYIDIFVEKFIGSIEINSLETNPENLIMVFNIIEFDKIYLNSNINSYSFLYSMLKKFSNFETKFTNFIIYKYYRGYLKFKLGDVIQANKEYLEIVSEVQDKDEIILKYIKVLNSLLKVQMNNVNVRTNRADISENIQFLEPLFTEISKMNKIIALKLGFNLFNAYIEGKEYNKCLKHLLKMKQILKKDLLRGYTLRNGIDYYLAIASRIGYIGVLLNDKISIGKAIKKIKKALGIIGKDVKDDNKILQLYQAYRFVLANLEICLNQKTEYNILSLSKEFKRIFLPDFKSNAFENNIVTQNNKDSMIINLKIIDNEDKDNYSCSKSIMQKSHKDLNDNRNLNTTNFIIFLSTFHDKIYRYSESYIKSRNDNENNNNNVIETNFATKIKTCFKIVDEMVNKYIDDPFFQTEYAKILIIEIYSAYASILFEEKDYQNLKKIIKNIMDDQHSNLRSKLKIDKNIPSYGLWLKIKGDFYLKMKHFDAACNSYDEALKTLEPNHPKIPLILFNCGCAYYFNKNKEKSIKYLEQSVNSFLSQERNANYFGYYPSKEIIKKKIDTANNLLDNLRKLK